VKVESEGPIGTTVIEVVDPWLFYRCLKVCQETPEKTPKIFRDLKSLADRLENCNAQNQKAAKNVRLVVQRLARELGL
jgi:hypothetical protein